MLSAMETLSLLIAVLCLQCVCIHAEAPLYTPCPQSCTCRENKDQSAYLGGTAIDVDCKNKNLHEIPNLDVLENITIHRLELNHNKISYVPGSTFDRIYRVVSLDISDNPLRNFNVTALKGLRRYLEYITLQRVKLIQEPYEFLQNQYRLRKLDLTGTKTSITSNLKNGTFGYLRLLESLILKDCGIKSMHDKAFEGVQSVMFLDLANNHLHEIPSKALENQMELVSLHLDHNRISGIPIRSLRGMFNLQKLTLSGNRIHNVSKIEAAAFRDIGHNLMELDLSANQLKSLPIKTFENLFNLGTFKVSDNEIQSLPKNTFERMTHLTSLDLSGNRVKLNPDILRGLEMSLQVLKLARMHMTIETLPIKAIKRMQNLQDLDLSGNPLGVITNKTLAGINLKRLTMSHCSLNSIEKGAFDHMRSPVELVLNSNSIRDAHFYSDACLFRRLELNSNPLDCSCAFLELARAETTEIKGECETPHAAAGMDPRTASASTQVEDACQWQNKTQSVIICDWMDSGAPGVSVSLTTTLLGAAAFVLWLYY